MTYTPAPGYSCGDIFLIKILSFQICPGPCQVDKIQPAQGDGVQREEGARMPGARHLVESASSRFSKRLLSQGTKAASHKGRHSTFCSGLQVHVPVCAPAPHSAHTRQR